MSRNDRSSSTCYHISWRCMLAKHPWIASRVWFNPLNVKEFVQQAWLDMIKLNTPTHELKKINFEDKQESLRNNLSQPHFGQVWGWSPTLPKLGIWSPPGLPNVQSSTERAKTPCLGVFLVSLKRSWSVDVENGLALVIWTSAAQVMGKRRAGSQTGSLTPDH